MPTDTRAKTTARLSEGIHLTNGSGQSWRQWVQTMNASVYIVKSPYGSTSNNGRPSNEEGK